MPSTAPALPGTPIDRAVEDLLRKHVAFLCDINNQKFPGSQPVSFGAHHIQSLEREDYWVCEKSDGVRVLLLIVINPRFKRQEAYLIDRHNRYYEQDGLVFPHFENPMNNLADTLLDCELVEDVDPRTRTKTLRLLIFDCLVADGQKIMDRPLTRRYGRIRENVYKPFDTMLKSFPDVARGLPFQVAVKTMMPSYRVQQVIDELPRLQHGSDGLIFTPAETPYVAGTDAKLLKWKPASENSIDLKLCLHFPASARDPSSPDLGSKPQFALYVWLGGDAYDFFDLLAVPDAEWERMKRSGEQYHGRIVECAWEAREENWRIMRFRDDKPHANHLTVVNSVLESIRDGVEREELIRAAPKIRAEWKARDERRAQQPPPNPHPPPGAQRPPGAHQHPSQHPAAQGQPGSMRIEFGIMPRVGGGKDLLSRLYGPAVVDGWVR